MRRRPWGVWKWEPRGEAALRDLDSDNADARVRALQAVSTWQNPDPLVRKKVVARLSDRVREVRLAALEAVAELGLEEAFEPVAELTADPDLDLAVAAVHALSRMGELGVGRLRELLGAQDGPVRCQAAVGLAAVLGAEAGPEIRPLLTDEDPFVRWGVAAALGDVEDRDAVTDLVPLLRDPEAEVRFEAALALAKLDSPQGVAELAHYTTDRTRGYTVCEVLGRIAGRADEPALQAARRALRKAWKGWLVHPVIRVRAAASLAMLGDEAARRDLWAKASGRKRAASELALELVGEVGGRGAFELLSAALASRRFPAAAAKGLARLGGRKAASELRRAADAEPDPELAEVFRTAAAEAERASPPSTDGTSGG